MFLVSMVTLPKGLPLAVDYAKFFHLHVSNDSIDVIDTDTRVQVLNFLFSNIRAFGKGDSEGCYKFIAGRNHEYGEGEYEFQFPDNKIRKAFHITLQEQIEMRKKLQDSNDDTGTEVDDDCALVYQNEAPTPPNGGQLRKKDKADLSSKTKWRQEYDSKYYDVTIHSSKKTKELSLSFTDTYKIQVNEHLVKLFQYDLSVCLYYWPLHYIRSYKVRKDWNCFVLHSGRRCMSGEGELCFQFLIHGEAEKFYNTVLSTSKLHCKRLSKRASVC